jgi:restriction endonuclease S subunit
MLSKDFISVVDSSTYGAKMPRASWEFIGNLPTLVPSQDEQRAIAAFLDRETARIDTLITKIQESIDRLKEYRTALISAAVTGKIDVRDEVGIAQYEAVRDPA